MVFSPDLSGRYSGHEGIMMGMYCGMSLGLRSRSAHAYPMSEGGPGEEAGVCLDGEAGGRAAILGGLAEV